MRLYNLIFLAALGIVAAIVSACGSNSAGSQPTRVATQTPYYILVPVTTTPEPATVTPLPTITAAATAVPPRTATRVVVVRPTATKPPPPTAAPAGPSPTAAPACAFAPPTVLEPNDGAERRTFSTRAGSDTFIFKWVPPPSIGGDDIAYKIQMDSRKGAGKPAGSDTVYITHNKFVSEGQGQKYIYDAQRVHNMPQGDETVTVTWYVSVVKFKGAIDDLGYLSGSATECTGSRSPSRQLTLIVLD